MFRRFGTAVFLVLCFQLVAVAQPVNEHLVMGMPDDAGTNPKKDKNAFLMSRKFFALSYNSKTGTPNWVSWRLTEKYLGTAPRAAFEPDLDLPPGLKKIFPSDYKGSGFDRGHMCPHSDRSKDDEMSKATFVMTNMVPQSPENNQKGWAQLEMYCRTLVQKQKKDLFIVAGPFGKGGVGRNGPKQTIANGKVVVPQFTWKVILVVPAGVNDPANVTGANTRLIAVRVPNDKTVGHEWSGFRCSVEDIEEDTGFRFFDLVTDKQFIEMKGDVDSVPIGPAVPIDHGH